MTTPIDLIIQDQKERQLALKPDQSFIVQAPAGSGKTELLIQRFLTLLNHVKAPEEILAITFTKKAANEMRSRVIKALKQAEHEEEPTSAHARETWRLAKLVLQRDQAFNWHIINNPNQLRIQTIDSFCTYLTKQLPLLSHFGSQPDIADHPQALYREAVREVLSHVEQNMEWSKAISQLLLHLDNDLNKLHDLLINLLSKRDQWLPYLHFTTDDSEVKLRLEQHLQLVISDSLKQVKKVFPSEYGKELTAIARFAADQITDKTSSLYACRELMDLPSSHAKDKKPWLGLAKLLLTKSFSFRKRVDEEIGFKALNQLKNPQEKALHMEMRERLTTLITALNENEALRMALTELFFLPEPYYEDNQWRILKALLQVLKVVAAQLRLTFQQHGQIDFIENAQAAILALGHDDITTDLALALDYRISHILVDEFQDTSYTQYQLLEKLTLGWEPHDGRTLFVVGDPMQSIYRFREAEVGLFIRMRQQGIGHINLTPLTLAVNFRSLAPIVEWNNHHFTHIFPPFSDMATGAVNYSPSVSHQKQEIDAPIYIRGFVNTENEKQADAILDYIKSVRKNHPQENIALLVRSRGHLSSIIPALKKNKMAYRAIDIEPLALRPAIQDLYSLTCALLRPADRIAWLSVLRAPWCGLTLADLLAIAGNNPYTAIEEQLESKVVFEKLSPLGKENISRILPILKSKIAERERYDLRYWIESTWLLLGGPATLEDETDIDDVDAYFQLLSEIDERHGTPNLDILKEKINQLYATTDHPAAELQIMTIHTAKGLEFDTVILPHLERKMPYDDKALLAWMERPLSNADVALLLAPLHAIGDDKDVLYEYICRQQRIKTSYEVDRLLYVATTRAKKRLGLFFNITQNEKQDFKTESGSFLEKLWPLLKVHANNILSYHEKGSENDEVAKTQERYLKRLSQGWQNPIKDKLITKIAFHQKQNGFQLINAESKWIGIVLHSVLQHISQFSLPWWQSQSIALREDYLSHQLKQLGMCPDKIKNAAELLNTMLDKALADKRGQWILHQHHKAQSEFALTTNFNNQIERIIIDRTFIDEEGTRWIIDYKAATLTHQDLTDFLENEKKKYMEKMHQYYRIMQLIDERPIKLALYFPAIPAWQELPLP